MEQPPATPTSLRLYHITRDADLVKSQPEVLRVVKERLSSLYGDAFESSLTQDYLLHPAGYKMTRGAALAKRRMEVRECSISLGLSFAVKEVTSKYKKHPALVYWDEKATHANEQPEYTALPREKAREFSRTSLVEQINRARQWCIPFFMITDHPDLIHLFEHDTALENLFLSAECPGNTKVFSLKLSHAKALENPTIPDDLGKQLNVCGALHFAAAGFASVQKPRISLPPPLQPPPPMNVNHANAAPAHPPQGAFLPMQAMMPPPYFAPYPYGVPAMILVNHSNRSYTTQYPYPNFPPPPPESDLGTVVAPPGAPYMQMQPSNAPMAAAPSFFGGVHTTPMGQQQWVSRGQNHGVAPMQHPQSDYVDPPHTPYPQPQFQPNVEQPTLEVPRYPQQQPYSGLYQPTVEAPIHEAAAVEAGQDEFISDSNASASSSTIPPSATAHSPLPGIDVKGKGKAVYVPSSFAASDDGDASCVTNVNATTSVDAASTIAALSSLSTSVPAHDHVENKDPIAQERPHDQCGLLNDTSLGFESASSSSDALSPLSNPSHEETVPPATTPYCAGYSFFDWRAYENDSVADAASASSGISSSLFRAHTGVLHRTNGHAPPSNAASASLLEATHAANSRRRDDQENGNQLKRKASSLEDKEDKSGVQRSKKPLSRSASQNVINFNTNT